MGIVTNLSLPTRDQNQKISSVFEKTTLSEREYHRCHFQEESLSVSKNLSLQRSWESRVAHQPIDRLDYKVWPVLPAFFSVQTREAFLEEV